MRPALRQTILPHRGVGCNRPAFIGQRHELRDARVCVEVKAPGYLALAIDLHVRVRALEPGKRLGFVSGFRRNRPNGRDIDDVDQGKVEIVVEVDDPLCRQAHHAVIRNDDDIDLTGKSPRGNAVNQGANQRIGPGDGAVDLRSLGAVPVPASSTSLK